LQRDRLLVLLGQESLEDGVGQKTDGADEVRGTDDPVGVEYVDQDVLDVAGGAVERRADLVALALELVALRTVVLEHLAAALERRRGTVERVACLVDQIL